MTLLMERPASAAPAREAARALLRHVRFVGPWALPVAAFLFALLWIHTPGHYLTLYAAYFLGVVVLPGTLVHRAFRGSRGNLPEDLGLGAATGLFVLIVGWALCAATGRQAWLPGWPVLVVLPFLAVPKLWKHWRIPRDARQPLPAAWSWIVAGAAVVLVIVAFPYYAQYQLPPASQEWYPDLLYHLGLVGEMTRSMPFQVPQLAGSTLRYHYLSDADMAAASMITKIPAPVVLLRLWMVPIGLTAIGAAAAVTRQLTGKWWAGALGGVAILLASPMTLGSATTAFGISPVTLLSPSQTYAIPALTLLVSVAVDVLQGRRLGWTWLLVLPIGVWCAGAKSSTLPPFDAGLAFALIVVLLFHRDRWWRSVLLLGLSGVATLIGAKLFAGGGAGTLSLQPFAILEWFQPYRETMGIYDFVDGTRQLPLGIQEAGRDGIYFGLTLLAWWAVLQAPRLIGVFGLVTKPTRTDPAAWMLAGIPLAGLGAAWLLWHPSASQLYFWLCAAPFGGLLTVWLIAERARSWRPVVAGLLAGTLWELFAPHVHAPRHRTADSWRWTLFEPIIRAVVAAVLIALISMLLWKLIRGRAGRIAWRATSAGLVAAVLGAGVTMAVQSNVQVAQKALAGKLTAVPTGGPGSESDKVISADEQQAAIWLGQHSGRNDLFATNVHCVSPDLKGYCDARAFWPVGLSGRRALVESWGYTDQAVAANGVGGKSYLLQPAPYPDRFALNERAFTAGDAADVDQLRTLYHVKWLLADARELGGVSPDLGKVCTLRFRAGAASVYQL